MTVQVPGTSANLGPGFDCLGVALDLFNEMTVSKIDRPSAASSAMVEAAAAAFFQKTGSAPFGFDWSIDGMVPRSRGLGSSVTVRLGVLHGLNVLSGHGLSREVLFELCASLEGHPDNAAPASFGGFTACLPDGRFQRFAVDPVLKFVVLIPELEMPTEDARKVLPAQIVFTDAVKNTAFACAVTAAFASGNYTALAGVFKDYLHETYRTPLIPFLPAVIAAGVGAGALGGYLSGAGSSIACVTIADPVAVATAMLEACDTVDAEVRVLSASNSGVQVLTDLA